VQRGLACGQRVIGVSMTFVPVTFRK
jgi:hypothetical protein